MASKNIYLHVALSSGNLLTFNISGKLMYEQKIENSEILNYARKSPLGKVYAITEWDWDIRDSFFWNRLQISSEEKFLMKIKYGI